MLAEIARSCARFLERERIMTPAAYLEMAETEDRHWWFVARRAILADIIAGLGLPADAAILEVGSGTSGNLDMLARFGRVSAMEMDDAARRISAEKTGGRYDIRAGACPADIPFEGPGFDLICLFDVIEHIDDAEGTLAALRTRLAPGGRMLVTAPAYQWMWSGHDEFLHHKRRYSARLLRAQAGTAGLAVARMTYFNTLLFPLALTARLLEKCRRGADAGGGASVGSRLPAAPVNRVFMRIFAAERRLLKAVNLPFGLSLLGVFRDAGKD